MSDQKPAGLNTIMSNVAQRGTDTRAGNTQLSGEFASEVQHLAAGVNL